MARGYLKRPEKTAEVFIKNPFSDDSGFKKVYHTGDLAKYNDDGNLEFYGRIDFQVKIRGFRIELSEVEEIIRCFEGVQDATVADFDKPAGGKYIVGYVVSDKKIDIKALQKFIAKNKLPYMVPSFTLQIDKIPLNQNQKVDKKRLPIPEYKMEDYEPPKTPTEKMICEKMALALGLEMVGVNDDSFQIGGDSLTTIMLITECAHSGVNISSIYQYRTPRNLAAMKKSHSLTSAQIMYAKRLTENPNALYNNIPSLFVLKDDIDLNKMQAAVNKVLAHHSALRTKFLVDENGVYKQIYDETFFKPISITNLSDEEFDELKNNLVKPFNLSEGGFCRGEIYHTPSANYLFLDFHHIVTDGFSILLILNQIYACHQDENYKLPEDFYFYLLENILSEKETKEREEAAAYCEKIFRSEISWTPEEIPLKPDHDATKFKGELKMFPLDIPKEKLRGNVAFLKACALAVCAYNNSNRAVVRFTHYGRNNNLSMTSVGLLADSYPILLVKEKNDTPETLIAKVQNQVNFVESHLYYPYFAKSPIAIEKIVRFIYQKDVTKLGDFEQLVKSWSVLDANNGDVTDSLLGVSVFDNSPDDKFNFFGKDADKHYIFLERYAGNCYDEESEEKFRKLFIDSAEFLAGIK